jgi:hypothetical protein
MIRLRGIINRLFKGLWVCLNSVIHLPDGGEFSKVVFIFLGNTGIFMDF